ncbi:GTPBP4 [Symbiodinium sp. KB8]|nr:GTPBP4 [Symbiodinium sp. KB8]
MYRFKEIQTIPPAKQLVDIVLSKTQRKTPTVVHPGFKITRIRSFYMRKVKFCQTTYNEKFSKIIEEFPKIDDIHPFYADLCNVLYDRDHYKLALGQVNACKKIVDGIAKDYVKMMKFADSLYKCKMLKRAALGRMATAVKKLTGALSFLEEVRQHLGRLPSINPATRTLILTGYPNVGKSSFMNIVTNANVDVQPYAFTTKSLFIGHLDHNYVKWQVIDTPGILDHPLEDRNSIEMTAITALAHLPAAILFFVDVSEHCGFNLATQVALFHSIKPLFRNRPLLIILNKTDLRKISELSAEEKQLLDSMQEVESGTQVHFFETSCATKNGVDSALQKGCELLLERRVEQKVRTGKADSLRNRLHITAVTPPASRPPCIPLSVQQKRGGAAPAADAEAPGVRGVEGECFRVLGVSSLLTAGDRGAMEIAFPETQDKGSGKGFVKGAQAPSTHNLPQPPQMGAMPKAPKNEGIESQGHAAPSTSDALLQALLPHLQTESLPTAIQDQLGSFRTANINVEGKQLHALVAQQGQAKREITKLQFQKEKYENEWAKYVASLSDLFVGQLAAKEATLDVFQEKEEQWLHQLAATSQELQRRTSKGGCRHEDEAAAMDAEDDDENNKRTAVEAELALERSKARRQEQSEKDQELKKILQAAKERSERDRTPRRGAKAPYQRPNIDACTDAVLLNGVCAASSKASTMGEEIFDACEAEAAALVQAMSWLLACPLGTSMFLHYDCNSAGLAVTGDWKIPEGPSGAPRRVHRRARALFLLLQALGHDVKVEHVEAHTGDLMNELADCAAKAAAQCGPFSPWLRDDWKQVLVSDLVEWLWLLPWHARSYELPSLWDVVAGRAGDHVAKDFSSATLVPDVKKVPVHRPVDTVATCQWRVGTFNACTLRDGDDRLQLMVRGSLSLRVEGWFTELYFFEGVGLAVARSEEAQHASDLARVWCAFATWNRNRAAVQRADRALHFADVLTAVRWRAFFRLGKEVRTMLKTAKANKLSELAIRFRKVAEHGDTKQLFKALAPFKPGGQRLASVQPTVAVRGPSGEPFPDKAALAEFWSDHFGQIEGGERVTERELHDAYVEHASSVVDFRPCLDELPSVIDWEMCFRGLQAGKSPGPDGLSHDLIKAAGTAVPLKSYPLALKVAVTGVEPLRWRGGLAWAIFKRKGNGSQASHYRSILVSDVLGKRFHSWVRRSLSPTLEGFAPELQHGPVGKHAISEIALLVRTFQEHMRERRLSHALLFVDVQQAFYSLVRQLLLREESDIKDLVLLCETLKFSHDHIALVLQTFEHEGVGLDSLSSTWKSRLKDLCASTWFRVFGDSSPVRTLRGSKPGDPLADLLYGFVMASILKDIEGQLIDAGVVPSISVVGIMPQTNAEATHVPCAAAWQDDAVFMLGVDRACDLLPACRRAARLVHQCFQSRCLELNYTSGKTELVCSPVGVGAKKAKLDICKDPVLKLAFLPDVDSAHTVGCVPIYKHLGSFVDMSASLLPDINRRLGQAGSLIRPLRKRVFGDPHVALSTRRMLFRSLVLSRALVNVAAWSGMRIAEKLAWQSGVLRLYGALLVGPQAKHDAHVSHRELLRAVGLPAPIDLLRLERLRLLAQLLHKSCSRVHELLEASIGAQRCWLTEILDDWQWLRGLLSLSIPGDQEDVSIALGYLAGRTSQLSAWVVRELDSQGGEQLERERMEELGGAGVYSVDLWKKTILEDPSWKYDIVPEIMDGHNIVDFVDPDIDKKLQELEREEALLMAESSLANDDQVIGAYQKVQNVLDEVHSRMRQKRIERKLNKSKNGLPTMRKGRKKVEEVEEKLTEIGLDASKVRGRSASRTRASSLLRKRKRTASAGGDEEGERTASARARSRSRMGLPNEEAVQVTEKRRRKTLRQFNKQGKKGEADKWVPDLKPKHLYSEPRPSGANVALERPIVADQGTIVDAWSQDDQRSKCEKLLVLLRGPPGCGTHARDLRKSTFARTWLARVLKTSLAELEERPAWRLAHVCSSDDFCTSREDGEEVYEFGALSARTAHALNEQRVDIALRLGTTPIIVDNTHMELWEMQSYVSLALSCRYTVRVVEPAAFNPDWRDVVHLMHRNAQRAQSGKNVPVEVLKKMLGRFQAFSGDLRSIAGANRPELSETQELRIDSTDGCSYTLQDFVDEYGGSEEDPPRQALLGFRVFGFRV